MLPRKDQKSGFLVFLRLILFSPSSSEWRCSREVASQWFEVVRSEKWTPSALIKPIHDGVEHRRISDDNAQLLCRRVEQRPPCDSSLANLTLRTVLRDRILFARVPRHISARKPLFPLKTFSQSRPGMSRVYSCFANSDRAAIAPSLVDTGLNVAAFWPSGLVGTVHEVSIRHRMADGLVMSTPDEVSSVVVSCSDGEADSGAKGVPSFESVDCWLASVILSTKSYTKVEENEPPALPFMVCISPKPPVTFSRSPVTVLTTPPIGLD